MSTSLFNKLLSSNAWLYFAVQEFVQLARLRKNVRNNTAFGSEGSTRKSMLSQYNQNDTREYDETACPAYFEGRIMTMSNEDIRQEFLKYVFEEVDKLKVKNPVPLILEVGCGSCINLAALKTEYGDAFPIAGMDTSRQRMEVAKNHYKEDLEGVELIQGDITQGLADYKDEAFDMVFSMHCLELLSHGCENAVREMFRLAKSKIVLIEPVFDFAKPAQRLKLINDNHNHVLLKIVKDLGYTLSRLEALDIQSPPLRPSSIIVIDKE